MSEKKVSGDEVLQSIFAVYAPVASVGVSRADYDKARNAILDNDWLKCNGKISGVESLDEFVAHGSVDFRIDTNGNFPVIFRSSSFVPLFYQMDGDKWFAYSSHRLYDESMDTERYSGQKPYDVILQAITTAFGWRIKKTSYEIVNTPPHYSAGGIECIDALRSALGDEGFLSAMKFNVIKYLWRANHKNGVEDWNKALWYLMEALYTMPDGKERVEATIATQQARHAK